MAGNGDDCVSLAHWRLIGRIEEFVVKVINRPAEDTAHAEFRRREHIGQNAESIDANKNRGDYDQQSIACAGLMP